ncbi:DUF6106 family protein [uncultured Tyzzerella sp.]|uniref:DUF6106 family protein n=1 Tax=uncultured Tyzzerella sp. TaxID=2321398 RepID=UPI002942D7C5|nr:DUF6106 family protein [uncultured Tyzzerella sp.]
MNKFYEQFITKDYGTLPNTINIVSKAILLIGVFILAMAGILGIFLSIPVFIVFILIEVYTSKKFLEYEYEYYDKDITVSKIIGKKRRKVICNIRVGNILSVSNVNSYSKEEKVIRCTIKGLDLKEVVIFINDKNGKKVGYLLGIDEELLSILKKDNPTLFNYI